MAGAAPRAAGLPRDLAVTTKATMRLTSGMATQEQAVEVEVRAQASSVHSGEFQQRLAALRDSIRSR